MLSTFFPNFSSKKNGGNLKISSGHVAATPIIFWMLDCLQQNGKL
jgi:hypothetical protein